MSNEKASFPWDEYARLLGLNLQQARLRAGLSQERVAHNSGISTFTYQKLEKGESNPGTPANPRLQTLISLSLVLNIDIASLLPIPVPRVQNVPQIAPVRSQ